MGEDTYMSKTIDELYVVLEEKKKSLSNLKRQSYDIESDIVGIKEAIRTKAEISGSHIKKFGAK